MTASKVKAPIPRVALERARAQLGAERDRRDRSVRRVLRALDGDGQAEHVEDGELGPGER